MLRALCIFLLGGGLLYAMDVSYERWQASQQVSSIIVTAKDVRRLREAFFVNASRNPTEDELKLLIDNHVNRELLVNEAIRIGIHLTDSVVRERLIMNMGFLEQGEYPLDQFGNHNRSGLDAQKQETVFQRALAMGMAETDNVVRNRLEERMARIIARARVEYPDKAALTDYLREKPEQYGFGKRIYLVHAFFAKEHVAREAIDAIHMDWINEKKTDQDILTLADQSYVTPDIPLSEHSLVKLFGPTQAKEIYAVHSPVIMDVHEAATGFHLLQVKTISASIIHAGDFDLLEDRVIAEYMREKESLAIETQLQHWRKLYHIVIDMAGS